MQTTGYYAAMKRKASLMLAKHRWILKTRCSVGQPDTKGQILRFHLHEAPRAVEFIETGSRIEIFRDGSVTDELVQSFGWR